MIINELGEMVDAEPASPWAEPPASQVPVARWCDVCGKPFKPFCRQHVYCSFKCRQEANRYRARMRKRRLA